MSKNSDRRFVLMSHPTYFFEVGRKGAVQKLWGLVGNASIVLDFDEAGDLVRKTIRDVSPVPADSDAYKHAFQNLTDSMRTKGVADEAVKVHGFWIDELGIGIRDYSSALREFLESPEEFTPEEQEQLAFAVSEWIDHGYFALHWEQEFDVNESGEVVGS